MNKVSLLISFLSLYALFTTSVSGYFASKLYAPKPNLIVGNLVHSNSIVVNNEVNFKLPIHVLSDKPYNMVAFYTTDENEHKNTVNFNGEVATFSNIFLKEGLRKLSLHFVLEDEVFRHTFNIEVKNDLPNVSFNYYNDKSKIYIDASSSTSISNFESFIFSFDGKMITSKTPYASFDLPNSYGFYEINVSVLNTSQKLTSVSKSFTRSFVPIDINLNIDDKKSMSLILNEQAHFNLDFHSPTPKEVLVRKEPALQPIQRNKTIDDTLDQILKESVLSMSETDLSDSVTVNLKLSSFSFQENETLNLYVTEDLYLSSSSIHISEFSRVEVKAIRIKDDSYVLKPLKLIDSQSGATFQVAGSIFHGDEKLIYKKQVGSKTIDLTGNLIVKQ